MDCSHRRSKLRRQRAVLGGIYSGADLHRPNTTTRTTKQAWPLARRRSSPICCRRMPNRPSACSRQRRCSRSKLERSSSGCPAPRSPPMVSRPPALRMPAKVLEPRRTSRASSKTSCARAAMDRISERCTSTATRARSATSHSISKVCHRRQEYCAATGLTSPGYNVQPKDGAQFVKLFADAQFYSRTTRLHPSSRWIAPTDHQPTSTPTNIPDLRVRHLHPNRRPPLSDSPRHLLRPRRLPKLLLPRLRRLLRLPR